uniref:C2H2-type domain-containing protein n=1 Tax=Gongylonema pulchrum TaxID=637853 RepID=A0A183DGT4_9BILA
LQQSPVPTTRPESLPTGPIYAETSTSVFSPSGGEGTAALGKDDDEVASTSSSQNGSSAPMVPTTTCTVCDKNSSHAAALEVHTGLVSDRTQLSCASS